MAVDIRALGSVDIPAVVAAVDLFDEEPRADWTGRFLAADANHLIGAFDGARLIGFVTGVELTHPDKGTEMFLYELSVAERYRRQGIGAALVSRLRAIAVERGCYGMWVLTESANEAAQATYRAGGLDGRSTVLMIDSEWTPRLAR